MAVNGGHAGTKRMPQLVKAGSLQCGFLAVELPNSDNHLNFAVDLLVEFFLLFFPRKRPENPPKNSPQNSPGTLFGKIPSRISAEAFS